VRDTVRQWTYERYESIVRVHLTPAHVRGLYREKLDARLAQRSVLHIHRTLSKALKQAVMDGLTPATPPGQSSCRAPVEWRYGPWAANRCAFSSKRRQGIALKLVFDLAAYEAPTAPEPPSQREVPKTTTRVSTTATSLGKTLFADSQRR
jgi:integrase